MDCVKPPNIFLLISLTGIGFIMAGCTSVDTIRLTSQTFPSKNSIQEVEVMALEPQCAHIALAQLSVQDSVQSYEYEEGAILKKAADLGADAVVLHRGTKRSVSTEGYGGFAYNYSYPGWGYGSYGGVGYEYYGSTMGTPMTYDTTVRSLTGIAIRYKDGPRCQSGGEATRLFKTASRFQS